MSDSEFDPVASEYYDPLLHPTCRNLRDGSLKAVKALISESVKVERYLEIGAGRSVLEDIPPLREIVEEVVINDESEEMLKYSEALTTEGADLVCGDFRTIEFSHGGFDLVLASLGDAYNDEPSWRRIGELLRAGGICIFTTPSHAWSYPYRTEHQGGRYDVARFTLGSGSIIDLESRILPELDQARLVQSLGLQVRLTVGVYRSSLLEPISPKLDVQESALIPLVTGYLVTK